MTRTNPVPVKTGQPSTSPNAARPSASASRLAKISSAFRCCKHLLDAHYSPDEWNIYLFHFSDGDNSSEADSRECVKMLKEQLLPVANMFGYCQVASAYGSGNFINVLHEHLRGHQKVLTSRVNSKDDIYDSIKTFFGKGH